VSLQAVNAGWQKPLELLEKLLKTYGFSEGGWVLDAFCGSGSTSVAATLVGLNSFAFDKKAFKVEATRYRVKNYTDGYSATEEQEPGNKRQASEMEADDDAVSEDGDEDEEQAVVLEDAQSQLDIVGTEYEPA